MLKAMIANPIATVKSELSFLVIRAQPAEIVSPPVHTVRATYWIHSNKPTNDAINRPFTPKNAPDATELFVDARHPSNDEKLTKILPISVPIKIALTDSHQPRP